VLVLVTVAGWPLLKILLLSLQKQESGKYALFHSGGTTPFTGLTNYANALSDPTFWAVTFRTLVFTGATVAVSLAVGMAVAQLLNRVSRWARMLLTATLLFVWAVPSTVSTQIFYWLFSNQYGAVNYLLDRLPGVQMRGHDWFADPHEGLAVVGLVVALTRKQYFLTLTNSSGPARSDGLGGFTRSKVTGSGGTGTSTGMPGAITTPEAVTLPEPTWQAGTG